MGKKKQKKTKIFLINKTYNSRLEVLSVKRLGGSLKMLSFYCKDHTYGGKCWLSVDEFVHNKDWMVEPDGEYLGE